MKYIKTKIAIGMVIPFLAQYSAHAVSAQAVFQLSGTSLNITLSNTTQADTVNPAGVLTALFFDISGNPTLSFGPGAATVPAGSEVFSSSWSGGGSHTVTDYPGITDVSSEWALKQGTGITLGNYGIGSAGLGVFGVGDRFDTSGNLQGPDGIDGLEYGLTSGVDNKATGNGDFNGTQLIKNSVQFALMVPNGFSLTQIHNVNFVFGTSLPPGTSVPDGGFTMILLGASLLGLTGLGRCLTRK